MMKQQSQIILCLIACVNLAKLSFSIDHSHDAPTRKYEHHVSIQINGEHACSGSIYNQRHILTSSSCILGTSSEDITVIAGAVSLSFKGESYEIEKTISPDNIFEDIALLRTKKAITFHRGVRNIELANHNDYHDDSGVKVIGWDSTPTESRENNMLQEYSLCLYNKKTCREKNSWIHEKFLCVYDPAGHNLCDIDGGGAIISRGLQIGIFLKKGACYDSKDPISHTPVYEYLDWIKENSRVRRNNDHGSRPSSRHEVYPYHVSIRRRNKHICSGSIINERHVLTSNNCIISTNARDLRMVAGINSLSEKARVYRVQKIIPTYDEHYDIAILRITRKIIFNNRVSSIPVTSYSYDYGEFEDMTLTGWERNDGKRYKNTKLQVISLQSYQREKCKEVIPFLSEAYMCSAKISTKNLCNMDYGSPIVANGEQIALNPFGVRCENNDEPHLILPLSRHSSWIDRYSRV